MKWITLQPGQTLVMSYGLGNGHLLTRPWCIECNMLECARARSPSTAEVVNTKQRCWRVVISDISKHSISRELEGRKSHRKTLLLTSPCCVWGHHPPLPTWLDTGHTALLSWLVLVKCSSSGDIYVLYASIDTCLSHPSPYIWSPPKHSK